MRLWLQLRRQLEGERAKKRAAKQYENDVIKFYGLLSE